MRPQILPHHIPIRLHAQPGLLAKHKRAVAKRRHRRRQQRAQRVRVGVDFDVAGAAGRGFQLDRGHQPDAAAQPVRAELPALEQGFARYRHAAGEAAPFAEVGLDDRERAAGDGGGECRTAAQVLAGGKRYGAGVGQGFPFIQ